jgi:uncharacterized peroxidase-related enzyme
MSRMNPIPDAAATPEARAQLHEIRGAFGAVPAMFGTVAHSPAALAAMWGAFKALGGGRLGAALGEQIAVAVADRNRCDYCLAAHTVLGRKAGVSAEAMAAAQQGHSADPRTAAALGFAVKLVEDRAQVTGADLAALRGAGFDDGEIVEMIAHVALNLFTNYVNVALDVAVDFPRVRLTARAA